MILAGRSGSCDEVGKILRDTKIHTYAHTHTNMQVDWADSDLVRSVVYTI